MFNQIKEDLKHFKKGKKMPIKIDIKSLVIGLLVGIIAFLDLGATSGKNIVGKYRLSMAANDTQVFYGRINIDTGKIETWKYHKSNDVVPCLGDGKILLEQNAKSSSN
jgi:hypothetical protein